MTPTSQNAYFKFFFTFLIVSVIFLSPALRVQAKSNVPSLTSFIESVRDGNAGTVRGVYIQDVMAYPIVQQPVGYPGYVSTDGKVLTQFSMAAEVGNVGLLAHNYLAGASFIQLTGGQEVNLIYGDGRVESFVITRVVRYQALDPYSPTSEFRDLESKVTITAQELFRQVYRGDHHVTFQTCIEANGNSSWGRLFIIAEPKPIESVTIRHQIQ